MRKFRYLRDPLFLAGCALYGINRWLLKPGLDYAFLKFWFNDLLLAVCAVPVTCLIFRVLRLRDHDEPPSVLEMGGMLLAWSVLCEWIGPRFFSKGTADMLDVVMYFAGGAIAWVIWHSTSKAVTE